MMKTALATSDCKITVGIPVFNCEAYIKECLTSVLTQSFSEIEIICVNDGSADGTAGILHYFEDFDPRIRVFEFLENTGISAARNKILLEAKGEYIYFLDGDDYIYPRALEELYNEAKLNHLDMLTFNSEFFSAEKHFSTEGRKNPKLHGDYSGILSGREFFCRLNENGEYRVAVWRFLYRKAFLTDNNLYFSEDIPCFEDASFSFACYLSAQRISYSNKVYHGYRIRHDSIVSSTVSKSKLIGYFLGYVEKLRFLEHYQVTDERLRNIIQKRLNRARNNSLNCLLKLKKNEKEFQISNQYIASELYSLFLKSSKQDVTLAKLKNLRSEYELLNINYQDQILKNRNDEIKIASLEKELTRIKQSFGWKTYSFLRRCKRFMLRRIGHASQHKAK